MLQYSHNIYVCMCVCVCAVSPIFDYVTHDSYMYNVMYSVEGFGIQDNEQEYKNKTRSSRK